MAKVSARLLVVLFAMAVALGGAARRAHAEGGAPPLRTRTVVPDTDDVMVLTPKPFDRREAEAPTIRPAPDLSAFADDTVMAVEVVVDDATWSDAKAPLVQSIRPGDRLTPALVRDALAEVTASGYFADAFVTASRVELGVRVVVHVMPRRVADSVRVDLHGAALDEAELVAESELVAGDLPRHRAHIEALVQRHGFPAPQVKLTTRPTNDPLRVALFIDVIAGAPRRIERRAFYPFGGTAEDAREAETHYGVGLGARADEAALAAADSALEGRIRARGHYFAEVTHDVVQHRGLVVLRVRVDFGTKFETRFEGNDHYDESTLDGVLDLDEETDRTPNHLVQKLQDFYVKRGFLDVEVSFESRGGPRDPVSYLVFHVKERARVVVGTRSYPCLREDVVKNLEAGGPSSARAIGREIDSFLEEELPGADLFVAPRADVLDDTLAGDAPRGARPSPIALEPVGVYAPETYERAVQHVQELYRAEGFLGALVGPVQVLRRRCDPRSPPGTCRALPIPEPADACAVDASGLPLPVPPLGPGSTCEPNPDPAHAVTCEDRVSLRIPVKLGARTQLWDVAFSGTSALSPRRLGEVADVKLGQYVSSLRLDEARRRVVEAYREEGYAFADVKYVLDLSPDRTRARVRFLVSEGEKVFVRSILVRGNTYTRTAAVLRRVALETSGPYRASLVRKTEERIATLGTFASVSVALENPYVPQKNKNVVITVVERPRQYSEVAPGFSTGEGFRLRAEYGHNNLFGNGVAATLRLQLAYIPTALIIDPVARENYRSLDREGNLLARIGVRGTASIMFPEIGLGPLVRSGGDAIFVHDLQRDFYITKVAAIPSISYRPVSEVQLSFFQSVEFNDSRIFRAGTIDDYLESLAQQGQNITNLVRQLLVPDGESYVISQRLLATWDRRDNAFNASRGTYLVTGIEHVDGYPIRPDAGSGDRIKPFVESHFFKVTQTFGGYIPLPKGFRIAALTRVGANLQITSNSTTYPDRLFFVGGVDTMRGWNLNSFIAQDDVDRIFADQGKPDTIPDPTDSTRSIANPNKFTPNTRPIRGGNFMVIQRLELRIPLSGPFETVLFGDIGNLWIDPEYPFDKGRFPLRAAVGTGLRVQTPVGPLAVDYGINVTRKPYEDFGAINFAIGLF